MPSKGGMKERSEWKRNVLRSSMLSEPELELEKEKKRKNRVTWICIIMKVNWISYRTHQREGYVKYGHGSTKQHPLFLFYISDVHDDIPISRGRSTYLCTTYLLKNEECALGCKKSTSDRVPISRSKGRKVTLWDLKSLIKYVAIWGRIPGNPVSVCSFSPPHHTYMRSAKCRNSSLFDF